MSYEQHPVDAEGWTEWIEPRPSSYKMRCCDCSLVHELQFRIAVGGKGVRKRIQFRARRHKRATAASRRGKKKPA